MTPSAKDASSSGIDANPLLRMDAARDVEVEVVRSAKPPSGAGKMGMQTTAPALANAIFALRARASAHYRSAINSAAECAAQDAAPRPAATRWRYSG